jgi:hypothetical protein
MFWSGTYDIDRDPPITHSMIYLGREKSTGRRVMVGASDGRVYRDQSRFGVSISISKSRERALRPMVGRPTSSATGSNSRTRRRLINAAPREVSTRELLAASRRALQRDERDRRTTRNTTTRARDG